MVDDAVTKTIKTYEETAAEYFKSHFDINQIKQIADFFIKNLKGKKVLDVGCGPARDAKYFSGHGLKVTGIDLTSRFIELASQNVPNAKFIQMDMRQLAFPEDTFDGIWACASFLHIPKSEARDTLLEFKRVLNKNGLLYLSVKQGTGEKLISKEYYKGGLKFFAYYTEDELKHLVATCDFRILKIRINKNKDTWINVFANKPNEPQYKIT